MTPVEPSEPKPPRRGFACCSRKESRQNYIETLSQEVTELQEQMETLQVQLQSLQEAEAQEREALRRAREARLQIEDHHEILQASAFSLQDEAKGLAKDISQKRTWAAKLSRLLQSWQLDRAVLLGGAGREALVPRRPLLLLEVWSAEDATGASRLLGEQWLHYAEARGGAGTTISLPLQPRLFFSRLAAGKPERSLVPGSKEPLSELTLTVEMAMSWTNTLVLGDLSHDAEEVSCESFQLCFQRLVASRKASSPVPSRTPTGSSATSAEEEDKESERSEEWDSAQPQAAPKRAVVPVHLQVSLQVWRWGGEIFTFPGEKQAAEGAWVKIFSSDTVSLSPQDASGSERAPLVADLKKVALAFNLRLFPHLQVPLSTKEEAAAQTFNSVRAAAECSLRSLVEQEKANKAALIARVEKLRSLAAQQQDRDQRALQLEGEAAQLRVELVQLRAEFQRFQSRELPSDEVLEEDLVFEDALVRVLAGVSPGAGHAVLVQLRMVVKSPHVRVQEAAVTSINGVPGTFFEGEGFRIRPPPRSMGTGRSGADGGTMIVLEVELMSLPALPVSPVLRLQLGLSQKASETTPQGYFIELQLQVDVLEFLRPLRLSTVDAVGLVTKFRPRTSARPEDDISLEALRKATHDNLLQMAICGGRLRTLALPPEVAGGRLKETTVLCAEIQSPDTEKVIPCFLLVRGGLKEARGPSFSVQLPELLVQCDGPHLQEVLALAISRRLATALARNK